MLKNVFETPVYPEQTIQNKQSSQRHQKPKRDRNSKCKTEFIRPDDQDAAGNIKQAHGNVKDHPELIISLVLHISFPAIHKLRTAIIQKIIISVEKILLLRSTLIIPYFPLTNLFIHLFILYDV